MNVVLDLQMAQQPGIAGRHALAFAQAVVRNRGGHDVTIALCGGFPDAIPAIRAEFGALLPAERLRVWYPAGVGEKFRDADAILRDAFLRGLAGDVIHVCAPSEPDSAIPRATPLTVTIHAARDPGVHPSTPAWCAHAARVVVLDGHAMVASFGANGDPTPRPSAAHAVSPQPMAANDAPRGRWDDAARHLIEVWEALAAARRASMRVAPARKLRLAFVSPLPPERTGIADYAAELLPSLSAHYDIDVVVAQANVDPAAIPDPCRVRDVAWLRANAGSIDRVLYQIGNSAYHAHMLPLLQEIPGVVDMHDVYVSGLMAWLEARHPQSRAWGVALLETHGFAAVKDQATDPAAAMWRHSVHAPVTHGAVGVIVHSAYARNLLAERADPAAAKRLHVVPHGRTPRRLVPKREARAALAMPSDAFVVAAFGFLGPTKWNHRLARAWARSAVGADPRALLTFVGEDPSGEATRSVIAELGTAAQRRRTTITGFVSSRDYALHLAAADVAVQLRTNSRGESSWSVLDAMAAGLPVIVNANGSMAELPRDAVWMLDDDFDDAALSAALEELHRSPPRRWSLAERARETIHTHHRSEATAAAVVDAIETAYQAHVPLGEVIDRLAAALPATADLASVAIALDGNHPIPQRAKRLYLDVTETARSGRRTGIERVARSWTRELLLAPPAGLLVEPVRLSCEGGVWVFRHARRFGFECLDVPPLVVPDDVIAPAAGDVLLSLDYSGTALVDAERAGLLRRFRDHGVRVLHAVFDLLPVSMPEVFPPDTDVVFRAWLDAVGRSDGAICISRATADELRGYLTSRSALSDAYRIASCHLGADIRESGGTAGLPAHADAFLHDLRQRPTFLMVGTVEPRKGYLQVQDAFEHLWRSGVDVNLVIVGQEGWLDVPPSCRRDLPETVRRLRASDPRCMWIEGASDEFLDAIYGGAIALVAASFGEGFGLPLIEAARHRLPILARDIPIFREVAGDHASYFHAADGRALAQAIVDWLAAYEAGTHPRSDGMPWSTWRRSADRLLEALSLPPSASGAWIPGVSSDAGGDEDRPTRVD